MLHLSLQNDFGQGKKIDMQSFALHGLSLYGCGEGALFGDCCLSFLLGELRNVHVMCCIHVMYSYDGSLLSLLCI
jgi:hypothetical protein